MNNTLIENIEEFMEEDMELLEELNPSEKVSLWVKEKSIIRPSTDITLLNSLEPGEYSVHYSKDFGYYCQKIDSNSDELFIFSETITPMLLEEINLFWEKRELFAEHKLVHKRGILLEGYSGVGKSSIISQVSNELIKQGGVVFKIQNFKNLDDYVGFMQLGFKKIQPETSIITILEDIDQYADIEAELLDFLDGKMSLNHHLIIATSNNTEDIPDTFLRPSRLDLRIEVSFPSAQTRREYFTFKEVPEPMLNELVELTDDCSIADLKEIFICIFLLDYSLKEAVEKVRKPLERKNYLFGSQKREKIGL